MFFSSIGMGHFTNLPITNPFKSTITFRYELKQNKHLTPLTYISLASFLWNIGKQCRSRDLTPPYSVSDQVLHCLLTECSIKIWWKKEEIPHNNPKIGNGLVLLVRVGKFIRLQRVIMIINYRIDGKKSYRYMFSTEQIRHFFLLC